MSTFIKKVEAIGVFGRFDIRQEFQDGINIVVGKNGAGKTTLLHIMANALSGDFDRFKDLKFNRIKIWLSDGKLLQIINKRKDENSILEVRLDRKKLYPVLHQDQLSLFEFDDDLRTYWEKISFDKDIPEVQKERMLRDLMLHRRPRQIEAIIPIAYFPAFRTMIEAWASAINKKETDVARRIRPDSWKDFATSRARDWFGGFTPMVNFPSIVDIEEQLANEIERARSNVWRTDQSLLSDTFFTIFGSLSDTSEIKVGEETLSANIQELFSELEQSPLSPMSRIDYRQLRDQISALNISETTESSALRVLKIYRDTLQSTLDVQKKSFEGIQLYLSSVNEFLDGKSLVFKPDIPVHKRQSILIRFEDELYSDGLRSLSSGERQIMTLVYAATHMSQQQIVLIDEPEISLHVDWQRKLIKRMSEQMGERQIIACTHSPVIGSDHLDKMQELSLYPTNVKFPEPIEDSNDVENPF